MVHGRHFEDINKQEKISFRATNPVQFQKSPSSDFIWRGTTSRDFVARGRPLCGQKRLAPLAKRSTCGKSTRPGNKAHQTLPVNRLSVWGKGEKIARRGKGKGKELLEHRLSSEMWLKER